MCGKGLAHVSPNAAQLLGGRLWSPDGLSAGQRIAVQLGAMPFQPAAGVVHARHRLAHQGPETRTVVHFLEMRDFMRRDIIKDESGRQNETP